MGSRLRIVHLSDIHFGSSFNHELWNSIKQHIRRQEPDLIVVSGDFVQSPFPLMMILARQEIDELCRLAKAPYFAVPGNHDVAFWGNIRIWPFTRLCRSLFSPQMKNRRWLAKYPSFSEFYRYGWLRRNIWRLRLYLRFLFCLHWLRLPWIAAPPDTLDCDDQVPVRLFGMDSNHSSFLAAGRIPDQHILRLARAIETLKENETVQTALFHRLVVLHHHPLPIPYSRESVTNFEPFLVLREAGTLLNELSKYDIDLVLHGHRHMRCFSRIAYGSSAENPRSVPVLSAASPTAKEHGTSANSFNVIDLFANGRIAVTEIRYGSVASAGGQELRYDALSVEDIKIRSYRRALSVFGTSFGAMERSISIGDLGETLTGFHIRELRVRDVNDSTKQHHTFSVDLGLIDPGNICLVDASQSASIDRQSLRGPPAKHVEVTVHLPALSNKAPVSYGLEYHTSNNYRLSRWELTQVYPAAEESTSVRIRFPTRKLRMRLRLPELLLNPEPELLCFRPRGYPQLEIDPETGGVKPSVGDDAWELDADVTEHEKRNLTELGDGGWEVDIDHPLIGYRYQIRWDVRDAREELVDAHVAGETEAFRLAAVKYRGWRSGNAAPDHYSEAAENLRYVMQLLLEEFNKRFGAHDFKGESTHLCLFTYNANTDHNRIVAVEEVSSDSAAQMHDIESWTMAYGQGGAGLAFKTSYPHLYFGPAQRLNRRPFPKLFQLAEQLKLEGVLSIPVYHPRSWRHVCDKLQERGDLELKDFPSPHEVVGVLSFGSDSPGSGLGMLHNNSEAARDRFSRIFEFFDVVQAAAPAVINSLTHQFRKAA